jgi:hypothetical protein
MITGLKIARETTVSSDISKGSGTDTSLAIDGTAFGTPGQIGPKLSLSQNNKSSESFTVAAPFVLAYRLRKVFVRFWSDEVDSKEYRRGELSGVGDDSSNEDSEAEDDAHAVDAPEEVVSARVDKDDFGTHILAPGFKSVKVTDESNDEDCYLMY